MNPEKARLGPALSSTFASLLYPQVVMVMFLPFVLSIFLVLLGLWLTWGFWMSYVQSGPLALQPFWFGLMQGAPGFMLPVLNFLSAAAPWLLFILLFALSYPIIISLNLVMVSLLASTYLVKFLARREYQGLEFKGKPRVFKGLMNTLSGMVMFLAAWFVTLPLWLIPGVAFALPFLLTAWLNRRLCSFDALTDLATDEEMIVVLQKNSTHGYVLGLVTSVLNYIPFAFFISPVMTMVAFIHFNLQGLSLERKRSL